MPSAPREARWDFISRAIEAGWTVAQTASTLGIQAVQAEAILEQR